MILRSRFNHEKNRLRTTTTTEAAAAARDNQSKLIDVNEEGDYVVNVNNSKFLFRYLFYDIQ